MVASGQPALTEAVSARAFVRSAFASAGLAAISVAILVAAWQLTGSEIASVVCALAAALVAASIIGRVTAPERKPVPIKKLHWTSGVAGLAALNAILWIPLLIPGFDAVRHDLRRAGGPFLIEWCLLIVGMFALRWVILALELRRALRAA